MFKDSKSLEISCYVLGAGAFGVFFRWMQLQLAYNDESLPDRSAWNILVPLLIIAAAFVFSKFVRNDEKAELSLSDNIFEALHNDGKIFSFVRCFLGLMMVIGSILLFAQCEADRNATFFKVLAVLGFLSGISFTLFLTCVNKPNVTKNSTLTLLSIFPIALFAVWLLTCYKTNSINPIGWDYAVEIVTLIITALAFFRIAGFAFGVPDAKKSMFFCMFGGMLCIMSIADNRYIGQQIMLASTGLMLTTFNWIMMANLRTPEEIAEAEEQARKAAEEAAAILAGDD